METAVSCLISFALMCYCTEYWRAMLVLHQARRGLQILSESILSPVIQHHKTDQDWSKAKGHIGMSKIVQTPTTWKVHHSKFLFVAPLNPKCHSLLLAWCYRKIFYLLLPPPLNPTTSFIWFFCNLVIEVWLSNLCTGLLPFLALDDGKRCWKWWAGRSLFL